MILFQAPYQKMELLTFSMTESSYFRSKINATPLILLQPFNKIIMTPTNNGGQQNYDWKQVKTLTEQTFITVKILP